jgi:hypothetical protein
MQNKVYQVFTHKDLDGAGSLLAFLWANPDAQITYKEVTNLQTDKIKEFVKNTFNLPSVLIFDLGLRDEFLPDLDHEKITFIDHHIKTENFLKKFKKSKIIYENLKSNVLLVRKLFKKDEHPLTEEQKKLILYINDFESDENVFEKSYDLNILFWTQFKNNFNAFINFYKNGFVEFTDSQLKIIKSAKNNANEQANKLKCFKGEIIIEGDLKKILAVTTESFNNLVDDILIKRHNPDIYFNINISSERVLMKQLKSKQEINLLSFCKKYCDGDGNNKTCKGKMTPLFMELTKNLKPL